MLPGVDPEAARLGTNALSPRERVARLVGTGEGTPARHPRGVACPTYSLLRLCRLARRFAAGGGGGGGVASRRWCFSWGPLRPGREAPRLEAMVIGGWAGHGPEGNIEPHLGEVHVTQFDDLIKPFLFHASFGLLK